MRITADVLTESIMMTDHVGKSFIALVTPKNDECLISPYNITTESHEGLENKGNDHQLKKLLIVKQILLLSTSGNV